MWALVSKSSLNLLTRVDWAARHELRPREMRAVVRDKKDEAAAPIVRRLVAAGSGSNWAAGLLTNANYSDTGQRRRPPQQHR